jgi:uncharacterized iron-regulated membrane protein
MTKAQATTSVRLRRFVRQLHRWLGLLIAVQVMLWIAGGLIMSSLDLDAVRGEDRATKADPVVLDPATDLIAIEEVLRAQPGNVTAVVLTSLLDQPVYRIESTDRAQLVDARTGKVLSPMAEESARTVALRDYDGPGRLKSMEWVTKPELEVRGPSLPLWRARFDDERNSTLYVSPTTGQVVARRNDLWRAFDVVWMLHIMDYEERDNFNHPLLVATAATALLFVVTGLFMLGYSFLSRRAQQRVGMAT